ncbi:MAG: hypothetical protein COV31_01105 [Candidatus Yanofskybacteria bacterium CG10_big_fil_rev_8_21_14_0_10_46_23]|uniref:Peptidase C39-like domain-containing protein n=1 Tax=Candidatus Yanofskybacteria bacterium CG10_big_fil_rev_8_21_14_0_10_46_23 TaxID=1975098 RepID=A0A2H0R6K3_9BACT|nr:MAG: hypothetical protein COV31_01105 [Candidatus Yanofskybacteria bacterium CG10_big_fil_rev_8_21_14_0_10_46_23]
MRQRLIIFGTIILVSLVIYFGFFRESRDETINEITSAENYFISEVQKGVVAELGQPFEGFESAMFLAVYPGLVADDFNNVEIYGDLNNFFVSSSADNSITPIGMITFLNNVAGRLNLAKETESDIDFILDFIKRTPGPSPNPITTPTPIFSPAITSTPRATIIKQSVPFTAQAPFGDWADQRQQDACEEASALMAVYWARGITALTPQKALGEIITASDWQEAQYGTYNDTSAQDTVSRIIMRYFQYAEARVELPNSPQDILAEIEAGSLVLVPAVGQLLGNPYFTPPGPERHMLVIIGYDYETKEFITNDPGTKRGKDYRYNQNVLFEAIRDYPTGNHRPSTENQKRMIIISK